MAATIILSNEWMEETGVTVSGGTVASSSMPLTNVLTPQPSEVCRFSNDTASNTYFVFHLASIVRIDGSAGVGIPHAVFVGYTNISGSGQIRIRAAESEADLTAAPVYDSGGVQFWHNAGAGKDWARLFPRGVHHLQYEEPIDQAATGPDWWRVDIDDDTNPDGYVEVGVISIGNPIITPTPVMHGWNFGATRKVVGQSAMGGQIYRRGLQPQNTLEATFQVTDVEDALALHDFVRLRGEATANLMSMAADDEDLIMNQTVWGTISATNPIQVPYHGLWQMGVRAEEMP